SLFQEDPRKNFSVESLVRGLHEPSRLHTGIENSRVPLIGCFRGFKLWRSPTPRYTVPLLVRFLPIPRWSRAFANVLLDSAFSPLLPHHSAYAANSSRPPTWSVDWLVQRSLRNLPTASDSRRYSRVALSTTGADPNPCRCHSRHPRTAHARMPLSSASSLSRSLESRC